MERIITMKTFLPRIPLAAVLFCLMTFSIPSIHTAQADTTAPQRTISVSGEAQVNIVPDQVVLSLGVETWDKNLKTAKAQNDERVAQILGLTKDFGVAPEKVKTDYISIEPRYQDGYQQKDFIGFFVRKNVVITLSDISKFEDLLSSALDNGANYVLGIDFRTTELRKYRDQARDAAIKAAREKAEALSGALGLKIGKAVSISEDNYGWWYYGGGWGSQYGGGMTQNSIQNAPSNSAASSAAGEAISPGQIGVTARVSIVFELAE
jgi:uncharacterized protein